MLFKCTGENAVNSTLCSDKSTDFLLAYSLDNVSTHKSINNFQITSIATSLASLSHVGSLESVDSTEVTHL